MIINIIVFNTRIWTLQSYTINRTHTFNIATSEEQYYYYQLKEKRK